MLHIIYQVDRPHNEATCGAHHAAHLTYLNGHQDILVLGGAILAEDGKTRTGSVLIINVPGREEAERFSANAPFRKARLFERVEINRLRQGQWNPEVAAKTAEGN
jgi:uncharacterized protein